MASISSLVSTLQVGYGSRNERVVSVKGPRGPGRRAEVVLLFTFAVWNMEYGFGGSKCLASIA